MTRLTMLFALLILACVPSARAAEINDAGAAHLKGVFTGLFDYQQKVAAATKGRQFKYEGEVSVEPAGTYYAVTLPHVTVVYPDGEWLAVGMVSINAAPAGQPGQWKMSIALPTPMTLYDKVGNIVRETHIGSQQAAGLWREDIENFSKLDARYQNITIDDKIANYNVLIPRAAVTYNLAQGENGRWSGPVDLAMSDIQASFEKTGTAMTIASARMRMGVSQLDPAITRDYKTKVQALLETDPKIADKNSSGAHALGLYNMMLDVMTQAMDGMSAQYELSGITLARTEEGKTISQDIASVKAGASLDGLLKNSVNLHLQFLMSGLTSSSANTLLPRETNIALKVEKIPLREIAELGKSTLQVSLQQPDMAQMAGLMLLTKIPAVLSKNGTTISIPQNYIGNDSYRIDLDGRALADSTAVNAMTAQASMGIMGLEWLMTTLQNQPLEAKRAENRNSLLEKLNWFRQQAKVEKTATGADRHVVNLEMTKEGKVLLNGKEPKPQEPTPEIPIAPPSGDTEPPR